MRLRDIAPRIGKARDQLLTLQSMNRTTKTFLDFKVAMDRIQKGCAMSTKQFEQLRKNIEALNEHH